MENTVTNLPFHCPLDIRFLLHCHVTREPYEPWSGPVCECAERMERMGLIQRDPTTHESLFSYETTPLGRALVEAVLLTPVPRVVYVNEQGVILNAKP
ncbi:MAG: hypothetical protein EBS68_16140 [Rhodobacteraceae bacterium]|jgi:hypothetical protein|nr:hypothetical protein [Paracoccaceae bacterium]